MEQHKIIIFLIFLVILQDAILRQIIIFKIPVVIRNKIKLNITQFCDYPVYLSLMIKSLALWTLLKQINVDCKINFRQANFYIKIVNMNILDIEQMTIIQKYLLSQDINQQYALQSPRSFPTEQNLLFKAQFFEDLDPRQQQQILKFIKNTQSMKLIKANQANQCLKLFTFALFSFIFPTYSKKDKGKQINKVLLQTIKCSLYSKDIDFNQIMNIGFKIDNIQAKGMLARLFIFLSDNFNGQKMKYLEWVLQKYSILFRLFVIYFRIILFKLGIKGAENYRSQLNFNETITNLSEFFDINYRNSKNIFLFWEENYFLAAVQSSYIIGKYFQNQSSKNIQQTNSKPSHQFKKKSDVYNYQNASNFNLQISRSSLMMQSKQITSPYFQQAGAFGFNFKRQQDQLARHERLKQQFEKIILNSQTQSVRQSEMDTPVIGGNQFAFSPDNNQNNQTQKTEISKQKKTILRRSTFNPALQIDQFYLDPVMSQSQQSKNKNIVSVKDKYTSNFSPQVPKSLTHNFSNFINDLAFLGVDNEANDDCFKSSSGKIAGMALPHFSGQCKCIQSKKSRNRIASKVVQSTIIPLSKNSPSNRSPRYINNLKTSQNCPSVAMTHNKDEKSNQISKRDEGQIVKQSRTPTFIKLLKKDKDDREISKYSISSKSKSKSKSKTSKYNQSIHQQKNNSRSKLGKQVINKINNKFIKFSTILHKRPSQITYRQSKSAKRKEQSSSLSKRIHPQNMGIIKSFDTQNINTRPGLLKSADWRPNQKVCTGSPGMKKCVFEYENKRNTMRIYGPVHIITPTVYFNGDANRDNTVTFNINENSKGQQREISKRRNNINDFKESSNIVGENGTHGHWEKNMVYNTKKY